MFPASQPWLESLSSHIYLQFPDLKMISPFLFPISQPWLESLSSLIYLQLPDLKMISYFLFSHISPHLSLKNSYISFTHQLNRVLIFTNQNYNCSHQISIEIKSPPKHFLIHHIPSPATIPYSHLSFSLLNR